MASHGVTRVTNVVPKTSEQQAAEKAKIDAYQSRATEVFKRAKQKDYSEEALNLTGHLLQENPEFYTVWNYRRRILMHLLRPKTALLDQELALLMPLMLRYPKCYWIWSHRQWVLAQFASYFDPEQVKLRWTQELELVSKMLSKDSRNFHGWNYRRVVNEELESMTEDLLSFVQSEFDYTTKMIKTNLSNFSAWHQRGKLIPRLLDLRKASKQERKDMFNSELKFIEDAVLFDPSDQSLWFYHEFIMSNAQPGGSSKDSFVVFNDTECKVILQSQIKAISDVLLEEIADEEPPKLAFQSLLMYSLMLVRCDRRQLDDLRPKWKQWLDQLSKIDPMRAGRWKDEKSKIEDTLGDF